MPHRDNLFAKGHYYHVYNRGAGRGLLFFNTGNYEYCLHLIKQYHQKYGAAVIAYRLMPNHYHFLLRQESDLALSKFINVLFNSYVQAVNRQQERKGTLFEGRFRSVFVDRDEYLTHLCRYIHLNPVKARLVSQPEEWLYSNYAEWIGKQDRTLKVDSFTREWFPKPEDYRKFVVDYKDELRMREKLSKYVWD